MRDEEVQGIWPKPPEEPEAPPGGYTNGHVKEEEEKREPDLVCVADVEAKAVDWLWRPYIPKGMLSMLSGDPSAGKSFIMLDIAAALSHGKLLDGRLTAPAHSVILTTENPIAECIRPRFDSLGGDPKYLHVLRGVRIGKDDVYPMTLRDVEVLQEVYERVRPEFVAVDPIQSYLGATIDMHRANETRPVLDGLARFVERNHTALTCLRHLSKAGSGRAIHRGLGSIDITGAARCELLAGSKADEPEKRALIHIKSNIGPQGDSLGYNIDPLGMFGWTGKTDLTAFDLFAGMSPPKDSKVVEAMDFLTRLLEGGGMEQKEIKDRAEEVGISYRTLQRAKGELGVESYRRGLSGQWMWRFPE